MARCDCRGEEAKERVANNSAAILLPESDASTLQTVQACMSREGYADIHAITAERRDIEVEQLLSKADVLVADVGAPSLWDRYGMAHALAVPTIRCAVPGAELSRSREDMRAATTRM